jgi:hypothetical protein
MFNWDLQPIVNVFLFMTNLFNYKRFYILIHIHIYQAIQIKLPDLGPVSGVLWQVLAAA